MYCWKYDEFGNIMKKKRNCRGNEQLISSQSSRLSANKMGKYMNSDNNMPTVVHLKDRVLHRCKQLVLKSKSVLHISGKIQEALVCFQICNSIPSLLNFFCFSRFTVELVVSQFWVVSARFVEHWLVRVINTIGPVMQVLGMFCV